VREWASSKGRLSILQTKLTKASLLLTQERNTNWSQKNAVVAREKKKTHCDDNYRQDVSYAIGFNNLNIGTERGRRRRESQGALTIDLVADM